MLMPPPYRDQHDQYLGNSVRTGERKIIGSGSEVLGRRRDGTSIPLDLAVSEVLLADRRIFTGIARDISERKNLERQVLSISGREKQRISQDLHDGLGQELTGIAFMAGTLHKKLAEKSPAEAADAAEISRLAMDSIEHTRALVKGLRLVDDGPDGLINTLSDFARSIPVRHGIGCCFECDDPLSIEGPDKAMHLYYIAQEAVDNALKHSGAKHIVISLEKDGDKKAVLAVSDGGAGIPPLPGRVTGSGLQIMRYRADVIGGSLEVRESRGGGTVVACCFEPGARHAD
jgi:two-component system sensor kinase FixL